MDTLWIIKDKHTKVKKEELVVHHVFTMILLQTTYIDNYSKSDYLDIFNLDKLINPTPDIIETKYKDLLNNIHGENMPIDNKNEITSFLTK